MRLVKTHGSLNEIFALDAAPGAWASEAELREFVRRSVTAPRGPAGVTGSTSTTPVGRTRRRGSSTRTGRRPSSAVTGCAGSGASILDLRGTDTEVVNSGGRDYTVHRAPSTPEGVRQVLLELPPLRFDDAALPEPFGDFTAVAVPNPHVISVVGEYSEPDLIELGKRADEVFAEGANVSFLQPLNDPEGVAPEVFVRTFERGAGLTPSCGSGVVASRAAYSRVSGLDPAQRLVVRNAGGVAAASIQVRDGAWYPVLEGNATVVYEPRSTWQATRQAR